MHSSYIEDPIMKRIMGGNFAERPQTVDEINEVCEEMVRGLRHKLETLGVKRSACENDGGDCDESLRLENLRNEGQEPIGKETLCQRI